MPAVSEFATDGQAATHVPFVEQYSEGIQTRTTDVLGFIIHSLRMPYSEKREPGVPWLSLVFRIGC